MLVIGCSSSNATLGSGPEWLPLSRRYRAMNSGKSGRPTGKATLGRYSRSHRILHTKLLELLAADRGDTEGHVLQVLGALLGVTTTSAVAGIGRVCSHNRHGEHDGGGNRRPPQEYGTCDAVACRMRPFS